MQMQAIHSITPRFHGGFVDGCGSRLRDILHIVQKRSWFWERWREFLKFHWNSPSKSFLRFKKCGSKSETDLEFLFSLREGLEKKGWK